MTRKRFERILMASGSQRNDIPLLLFVRAISQLSYHAAITGKNVSQKLIADCYKRGTALPKELLRIEGTD